MVQISPNFVFFPCFQQKPMDLAIFTSPTPEIWETGGSKSWDLRNREVPNGQKHHLKRCHFRGQKQLFLPPKLAIFGPQKQPFWPFYGHYISHFGLFAPYNRAWMVENAQMFKNEIREKKPHFRLVSRSFLVNYAFGPFWHPIFILNLPFYGFFGPLKVSF